MEDADRLIKETCEILDCSFVNEEDFEFNNSNIFEFLIKCLWKIDATTKEKLMSHVLPKSIAGRLMQATQISDVLGKWKIRGDIGFHNILYGSINTLRHVFVELIRRIPTEFEENEVEEVPNHLLEIAIDSINSESDVTPFICRNNKFAPELFHANGSCRSTDPRTWILNILSDSVPNESVKPHLPVKPKSLMRNEMELENPVVDEEDPEEIEIRQKMEEVRLLEKQYNQKMLEYEQSQIDIQKMEEMNRSILQKISQYDPVLLELLEDVEGNAPKLLKKIDEINSRIEKDAQEGLKRKAELKKELENIEKETALNCVSMNGTRTSMEIEEEITTLREEIDMDNILIEKLKKKLNNGADKNFNLLEKRNTEVETIIGKQEAYVGKILLDLQEVRKRQDRAYDMIDRSFSTILNTLIARSEEHGTRKPLESFLKIHLTSSEIVESIKKSAKLKMEIEKLHEEIVDEERKEHDKQRELIEADISEIENENSQLIQDIIAMDPTFDIKSFLE